MRNLRIIAAFALIPVASLHADGASRQKFSILHINADDHRADGLGALGHPLVKTPNLDTLVERGLAFTHCYTMGSMVGAVCQPSRTMLQTGKSWQHVSKQNVTDPEASIARVMSRAGYETWHCGKGTPYQGGTRSPCFFRWPAGSIPGGTECDALSAHIDLFPTLAEITGAKLSDDARKQVEGRSLLPVLRNPKAGWTERTLVHHVGRWVRGKAGQAKFSDCAIQNSRFTLVNNTELYDLKTDPGETKNVIDEHPDVVASLRAAYDSWWSETLPLMVNEDVVGPKINPMKELYWNQFGGGPSDNMLEKMNPEKKPAEISAATAAKPNILVILADDLGYGDLHCYNPERGKILTPQIDRLATQSMRFTDGHSSSGVCSPSRYSLLTGRYHWRTRLQAGIVGVFGEPLIAPDRMTIGTLAKQNGHRVPFIVRWPGTVKAGSLCNQLVEQADIFRTLADILGTKLPDNAGEDSFSLLPLLRGEEKPVRQNAVSASSGGLPAVRLGNWKYIPGPGSGGGGGSGRRSTPAVATLQPRRRPRRNQEPRHSHARQGRGDAGNAGKTHHRRPQHPGRGAKE